MSERQQPSAQPIEFAEYARNASARQKGLETGNGGGDSGGMDQRIAAVEGDIREIKAILGRLEPVLKGVDDRVKGIDDRARKTDNEIAELKGRVSQLPSTVAMLSFVLAVLAIAGLARFFDPRIPAPLPATPTAASTPR